MADEKKTLKFQMMMSPGEAEVLDDWMFTHRIRSRAEAIRRLTQLGMLLDKKIAALLRSAVSADENDKLPPGAMSALALAQMDENLKTALMEFITGAHVTQSKYLFDLAVITLEAFPLKLPASAEEAIDLARQYSDHLDNLDPQNSDDRDKVIRMLNTIAGAFKEAAPG